MSDFKFNCQSCGQHLSGDERYAGLQIVCPSCGKTVMVPTVRPPAGVSIAHSAPPMPAARPQPAPVAPQKTSGLAVASLVCSAGSFIIIPFGFIPGIICGHMAKRKIAAMPGLKGGGLAKAGLIVGYIALSLNVLVIGFLVLFFATFAHKVQQASTNARLQNTIERKSPQYKMPARAETTDTAPDGSGWTMKLADVEIPSGAVTGRVHGKPFKMEKVTLKNGWLNFSQGKDFLADLEMDVVVFENDASKLSGRTFTVPNKEFGSNPHIWMKWKGKDGKAPPQRSFTDRYALQLEFGTLSGGKLPGKIYLCVPDKEKSFIAGTFEAQVKGGK